MERFLRSFFGLGEGKHPGHLALRLPKVVKSYTKSAKFATCEVLRPKLRGCFSNWVFGSSSFPTFCRVIVTHPGHASLRSLVGAVMAPLHAYVGSDVESLALGRASGGAADTFGFFCSLAAHGFMREMARTSSGGG
jgi:hypothetical protein